MLPILLAALLSRLPDVPPAALPRPAVWLVKEAAVVAELLDRRELSSWFMSPCDYRNDLRLLAARARDLADAPPLSACMLFPERWLVQDMLRFNRDYQSHMEVARHIDPCLRDEIHAALVEAEQLYWLWDLVADARHEVFLVAHRRRVLRQLRERLGEEAFWAGALPPHVPAWRFKRAD